MLWISKPLHWKLHLSAFTHHHPSLPQDFMWERHDNFLSHKGKGGTLEYGKFLQENSLLVSFNACRCHCLEAGAYSDAVWSKDSRRLSCHDGGSTSSLPEMLWEVSLVLFHIAVSSTWIKEKKSQYIWLLNEKVKQKNWEFVFSGTEHNVCVNFSDRSANSVCQTGLHPLLFLFFFFF